MVKLASVYDEFFVVLECCIQNTYNTFCCIFCIFFMYLHDLSLIILSLSPNFRSVECITCV